MVQMQAESTLEPEGGVVNRLTRFAADGAAGSGVDQDARSGHRLRLIGMEDRHGVELASQGSGRLARHQGQAGIGRLAWQGLGPRFPTQGNQ
jgi:hypothetical protein